jgi:hypothetical protein
MLGLIFQIDSTLRCWSSIRSGVCRKESSTWWAPFGHFLKILLRTPGCWGASSWHWRCSYFFCLLLQNLLRFLFNFWIVYSHDLLNLSCWQQSIVESSKPKATLTRSLSVQKHFPLCEIYVEWKFKVFRADLFLKLVCFSLIWMILSLDIPKLDSFSGAGILFVMLIMLDQKYSITEIH